MMRLRLDDSVGHISLFNGQRTADNGQRTRRMAGSAATHFSTLPITDERERVRETRIENPESRIQSREQRTQRNGFCNLTQKALVIRADMLPLSDPSAGFSGWQSESGKWTQLAIAIAVDPIGVTTPTAIAYFGHLDMQFAVATYFDLIKNHAK